MLVTSLKNYFQQLHGKNPKKRSELNGRLLFNVLQAFSMNSAGVTIIGHGREEGVVRPGFIEPFGIDGFPVGVNFQPKNRRNLYAG